MHKLIFSCGQGHDMPKMDRLDCGKPNIVISSCLLGEPVRYDGGHKQQQPLHDYLTARCNIISICPEIEMGLGVPRAPIQIVYHEQQRCLREVAEPGTDLTLLAQQTARQIIKKTGEIDGWIFKARSPSCGINDTPIFKPDGQQVDKGSGMFAAEVLSTKPWLPCATELQLQNETAQQKFLKRCKILFYINQWLVADRSSLSLCELEQEINLHVNFPSAATRQLHHLLLVDNTRPEVDRLYQYRTTIMKIVNQA